MFVHGCFPCVIFPLDCETFLGGYIDENANREYKIIVFCQIERPHAPLTQLVLVTILVPKSESAHWANHLSVTCARYLKSFSKCNKHVSCRVENIDRIKITKQLWISGRSENAHVVFITSPLGDSFERNHITSSPAIFLHSGCRRSWFGVSTVFF